MTTIEPAIRAQGEHVPLKLTRDSTHSMLPTVGAVARHDVSTRVEDELRRGVLTDVRRHGSGGVPDPCSVALKVV